MDPGDFNGQGVVEYIVIVAVIVVIGLTVAGIAPIFLNEGSGVVSSTGKIRAISGPIAIFESVLDPAGDGIVGIQNNSGDALTLTRIQIGGIDSNFEQRILSGERLLFDIDSYSDECSCQIAGEKKTCLVKIFYTTDAGIQKTENIRLTIDCVNDSNTPGQIISPTIPSIVTLDATSITITSATLNGNITSLGGYSDINAYFQYKKTIDSEWTTTQHQTKNSTGNFSQALTGLDVNTAYQFKSIVLYNSQTVEGGDKNFTTDENVTEIYDWVDLNGMRDDFTAYYRLMNNISEDTEDYVGIGDSFETIGYLSGWDYTQFVGTFDGQGYAISDLNIYYGSDDAYTGLFAYLGSDAEVKNVGLIDVNIIGGNNQGGIAGYNVGTISNVYVTGLIRGNAYAGGIVGKNLSGGTINKAYNLATIELPYGTRLESGGIAGYNGGTISNVYNSGSVSGWQYIGGIAGYTSGGTISNAYNSGTVYGTSYVGGIVGPHQTSAMITNSFNAGNVSGGSSVGGIAGRNLSSSSIINSSWVTTTATNVVGLDASLGYVPIALLETSSNPDVNGWDEDTNTPLFSSSHNVYDYDGDVWVSPPWYWWANDFPKFTQEP